MVERIMPDSPQQNLEHLAVILSDLNMLRAAGSRERTEAEYRELLREAGFSILRELSAGRVSIIEAAVAQFSGVWRRWQLSTAPRLARFLSWSPNVSAALTIRLAAAMQVMLKTALVVGMLLTLMSAQASALKGANPAFLAMVDHLVYATPDLDRGISEIEAMLGVKASLGGQHPGRGTRNAVVSLGPATYLEIFAPDPNQPPPKHPRPFGLDSLESSRLVAWYVKSEDLDRARSDAVRAGVPLGEIRSGSRRRSDGVEISWRFTDPWLLVADGIVPLFIDWGSSPHPADNAARGASLVTLRAEHPDAAQVRSMLENLGIDLPVASGPVPAIIAVIDCPKGRVVLR